MNTFALIVGLILAVFVIWQTKKLRIENSKYSYPFLLFTFPLYYLVFAIYGEDFGAFSLELLVASVFFIIIFIALKLSDFYKFSLLALGYILHGIYDVVHDDIFINAGSPVWWPEFCGGVDIVIGLYLIYCAAQVKKKRNLNSVN